MVSRGALEFVDEGAALQRIFAQVLLNRVQPCRHHLTLHVTLPQVRRLQIEHNDISMSHHYSPSPHPSRHPPAGPAAANISDTISARVTISHHRLPQIAANTRVC
jgi:hypothetical protein